MSRDANGNLRPSSADTFVVTLYGTSSMATTTITPVNNNNGTFTISYQITTTQSYNLAIKLGGSHIVGSPLNGIVTSVGRVQAKYSTLITKFTPVTAG
jgi:hypothetical protein